MQIERNIMKILNFVLGMIAVAKLGIYIPANAEVAASGEAVKIGIQTGALEAEIETLIVEFKRLKKLAKSSEIEAMRLSDQAETLEAGRGAGGE